MASRHLKHAYIASKQVKGAVHNSSTIPTEVNARTVNDELRDATARGLSVEDYRKSLIKTKVRKVVKVKAEKVAKVKTDKKIK